MKQVTEDNFLPNSMVKFKNLYDLKDRFKKVSNCKLQSSTLRFELVNLGSESKPQNVNLGLSLSSNEILAFICLLKKYKYVIA